MQEGRNFPFSSGYPSPMETMEKLEILADAAKYDVSCSSSGSERSGNGTGSTVASGICHTWAADGRCVSLLKILMSNVCAFDCLYCVNRKSNDIPRATFSPEEIADLTMGFYRRNYIEGLFLSSGVVGTPDGTMERMIRVLELLRFGHRFQGYIHLKLIPGADAHLVEKATQLADRVSINLEFPTERALRRLAPDKSKESVFLPMKQIREAGLNLPVAGKKKIVSQGAAGMTTQMIVGADGEDDRTILRLTSNLYGKMGLKRVYYSAYVPVMENPLLPAVDSRPPLLREHRLYQADWLLRFYGFGWDELVDDARPNLDYRFDPKAAWALRHLERFPVEVNRAPMEDLLRVPGIGRTGAIKILKARRVRSLGEPELKNLGVVLKRARFFLTARGRYLGHARFDEESIASFLLPHEKSVTHLTLKQPRLF